MLSVVWRKTFNLKHGYHPQKDGAIYRYWWIGSVEIRWIFDKDPVTSLDLIRQNGLNRCLECNTEITSENYSGWDGFTEDGFTQPICVSCHGKRGNCHKCGVELTEENDGGILTVREEPWLGWSICKTCCFTRHHWLREVKIDG